MHFRLRRPAVWRLKTQLDYLLKSRFDTFFCIWLLNDVKSAWWMRTLMTDLLQNLHRACRWKNVENRSTFSKVMDKRLVTCFLTHVVHANVFSTHLLGLINWNKTIFRRPYFSNGRAIDTNCRPSVCPSVCLSVCKRGKRLNAEPQYNRYKRRQTDGRTDRRPTTAKGQTFKLTLNGRSNKKISIIIKWRKLPTVIYLCFASLIFVVNWKLLTKFVGLSNTRLELLAPQIRRSIQI